MVTASGERERGYLLVMLVVFTFQWKKRHQLYSPFQAGIVEISCLE
jgi:hypothetical protein